LDARHLSASASASTPAEFAITQPVFDVEQLRHFLKRIEHTHVPIVAGIWPLVSYRNAEFLHNEVPGVSVPHDIMERMRLASERGKEFGRDEGLKIARESLVAVREMIQGVQVSAPFNNVKYALEVFEALPEFGARAQTQIAM
jgi:homocysteine S-methyltransferase